MTTATQAELQKRLAELNSELNNPMLNESEFNKAENERADIVKKLRAAAQGRVSTLNELVKAINEGNFTVAEILGAEPAVHAGFNASVKGKGKGKGKAAKSTAVAFASDANPILFTVAKPAGLKGPGKDFSLHQGRVAEKANATKMFASFPSYILALKGDSAAKTLANVKKQVTPETKAAADKSEAELKEFADFLFAFKPVAKKAA